MINNLALAILVIVLAINIGNIFLWKNQKIKNCFSKFKYWYFFIFGVYAIYFSFRLLIFSLSASS
jgi:hypothetical protein